MARLIDLTQLIHAEMPLFPDHQAPEVTVFTATTEPPVPGRLQVNSSRLAIGLHTGTHMDAPFHFIHKGRRMEQVPLEQCVGPALLLDLGELAPRAPIGPEAFEPHAAALRELGKLVLNTRWHHRWGQPGYFTEHPVIQPEAGELLVECGVHLIGVDFPSVDLPPHPTHVVLLGSGMVIVENLTRLDEIGADRFHFTAFPLPLVGRDGCPVRAVATVGRD
jgi:kynurenine formamidase